MRCLLLVVCWLMVGCGAAPSGEPQDQGTQNPAPISDQSTGKNGSDWPCFLGPTGNSVSPEKGIISPWPKQGLKVVWFRKLGQGYAMPVISKGRLFLFERHGDTARCVCLKSDTAEELWKFEYPTHYEDKFNYNGGPRCCPVVDDERVYLHGVEGMLHCLRLSDGKMLWKVDTAAEFNVIQNFFGVGSTPVLEGEALIVQVGGSPKGSSTRISDFLDLKGNGSGVVAFDRRTGKVLYKISDELASYASPVLATINGRRWCFVFARGGLLGFEPKTGKVDFHFPWRCEELESVNASNPVVVGDRVLITECYGPGAALLQVKPGGYQVLWRDDEKTLRNKSLMCHWMTPIHVEGYVYGCSGRHTSNAELRCVELATGKVMWREPRLTRTSLLLIDGHFICLGEDGRVLLLKVNPKAFQLVSEMEVKHPKTGEPLLEYPCWAAPIVSHGLLYLRGNDYLVCLELIPRK